MISCRQARVVAPKPSPPKMRQVRIVLEDINDILDEDRLYQGQEGEEGDDGAGEGSWRNGQSVPCVVQGCE